MRTLVVWVVACPVISYFYIFKSIEFETSKKVELKFQELYNIELA
jgi:hypothetical protein